MWYQILAFVSDLMCLHQPLLARLDDGAVEVWREEGPSLTGQVVADHDDID